MNALVGYTGFVGSNLLAQSYFDAVYNSANIQAAYGTHPDLLIYAGMRAEKYLANNVPEQDLARAMEAVANIRQINPQRLVLISTIDVLKDPVEVDEDAPVITTGLQPYGYNRYQLERHVRVLYPDALIIRLPGLYGKSIKKNFIYDYIHRIPSALTKAQLDVLCNDDPAIKGYYLLKDDGFYQCRKLTKDEETLLQELFNRTGFSALHFTDSRSVYQFYPLSRLWNDINIALENHLKLLHAATEPVSAQELYQYLCGGDFVNELVGTPVFYDCRTKYSEIFGGTNGYILSKTAALKDINEFVKKRLNTED